MFSDKEMLMIKRPIEQVADVFKKKSAECLHIQVTRTWRENGALRQELRAYKTSMNVDKQRVRLMLQTKVVNNTDLAGRLLMDGHDGGRRLPGGQEHDSRRVLCAMDRGEYVFKVVKHWANGTNMGCPDMTSKIDIRRGTAWLSVYEVNKACDTTYLGTVEFERSRVKVAIPINKPSYLASSFSNASLLSGRGTTSYDIYLTTRAGYQYEAIANCIDDMYTVTIHEQNSRGGARQEITRAMPAACISK